MVGYAAGGADVAVTGVVICLSTLVDSHLSEKYYRAPLKIHISSLPRRRESSQINKLDSRLPPAFARVTGNDEFLEVPYSFNRQIAT